MNTCSNQDALGWIAVLLSCFAFVACGERKEGRVDSSQNYARATDFEGSATSNLNKISATNRESAFAPVSEISEFLRTLIRRSYARRTVRGSRLFQGAESTFQTLANRSTFERVRLRLFQYRPFWTSTFPPTPLFISLLKLRN